MNAFTELFPLQVVINLDSRPERLVHCTESEFPKINALPVRKPGVIFTGANHPWWNGAIGCMLSHYQVLAASLSLGVNVFIFEDDVSFIDYEGIGKSNEYLTAACGELEEREWDMFYMGGNLLKPCYQETPHLARLTHCQSTVSYGVNKSFLHELLEYIDLKKVSKPIDMIYADDVIPSHNCFISVPMLTIQRDSFSDIEQRKVKYSDYLEDRYWTNLVKDE